MFYWGAAENTSPLYTAPTRPAPVRGSTVSASLCSTQSAQHCLHRIAPECHSEPSVQVVVDALPAKLAEALLSLLLEDSLTYSRGRWRIFDQLKDMPRSTCHYALDSQARSLFVPVLFLYSRRMSLALRRALVMPVNGTPAPVLPRFLESRLLSSFCLVPLRSQSHLAQAIDRAGDCEEDLVTARAASPTLREAADIVNRLVQQRQVCSKPGSARTHRQAIKQRARR